MVKPVEVHCFLGRMQIPSPEAKPVVTFKPMVPDGYTAVRRLQSSLTAGPRLSPKPCFPSSAASLPALLATLLLRVLMMSVRQTLLSVNVKVVNEHLGVTKHPMAR